jgi:hypothetical protein
MATAFRMSFILIPDKRLTIILKSVYGHVAIKKQA